MIVFNKPPYLGQEDSYVLDAMHSHKMSGDGTYSRACQTWIEERFHCKKALLTPSCTAALEMAALLIDVQPGDEIIMPSYTFVSTANAFVLRGASIVFVDIRPDTLNLDEQQIEAAITKRTKAIVPVHYAGVACDMDAIMAIANRHGLYVIEDAAQAVYAFYQDRPLGTIGHFGCYSFHETKNYTSGGEGGALIINDEAFIQRAEIIREKGTNRSQFFRGLVDKYTWWDVGSSYLPGELQAAYLYAQLLSAERINDRRLSIWNAYHASFETLEARGAVRRPKTPKACQHNAHLYALRLTSLQQRTDFIAHMNERGILTPFHYVPLHSSPGGMKFGRFHGTDVHTTVESEALVRLPLWFNLSDEDVAHVIEQVHHFFERR